MNHPHISAKRKAKRRCQQYRTKRWNPNSKARVAASEKRCQELGEQLAGPDFNYKKWKAQLATNK